MRPFSEFEDYYYLLIFFFLLVCPLLLQWNVRLFADAAHAWGADGKRERN
jgi:hypothetical protein